LFANSTGLIYIFPRQKSGNRHTELSEKWDVRSPKSSQYDPKVAQNQGKPEKTCGNQRKLIDKALEKDEGELRYSSPQPHEHW
jgi:hypothetical protein